MNLYTHIRVHIYIFMYGCLSLSPSFQKAIYNPPRSLYLAAPFVHVAQQILLDQITLHIYCNPISKA